MSEITASDMRNEYSDPWEAVADLASELEEEREARKELAEELEEEREARKELAEELEEEREARKELAEELENQSQNVRGAFAKISDFSERLDEVEHAEPNGEQDFTFAGTLSQADLMPLHQQRLVVEHMDPNDHSLTENQERAAWSFDHLEDRAHGMHGQGVITSNDIRKLFQRDLAHESPELDDRLGLSDPGPKTVKRTMKFIAVSSDGMIELNTDNKVNRLEVDMKELREYHKNINQKSQTRNDPGEKVPASSAT